MNRLSVLLMKSCCLEQIQNVSRRSIHVSSINFDIIWRQQRRLPKNPTSAGPLTDLPDYTFMDGRPTPMGSHQARRCKEQREITNKIIKGIEEVNFAQQRYQQKLVATEEERQQILKAKLKPKGKLLSNKHTKA